MATIAIIGALEKEIMQIKEELSDVCEAQEAGLNVVSGEFDGLTLVATTAGMGTVNAAAATQHLISKYAPQAVVLSGIAGGLNPKLHIDDVVIGQTPALSGYRYRAYCRVCTGARGVWLDACAGRYCCRCAC